MWPADLNAPTPAAPAEAAPTSASKLNLTIDGEKVITDGVAQTTTSRLIRSWALATSPRVNGGWIAKGWRNGHCYSESRDTLAEAVNGVVAQLKAATSEPEAVTPAAKPKRSNAIITRQADAVIAAIAADDTSKEALSEALLGAFNKGVELSVIIAKFLRAQVKIVRAEGGDPIAMQTKVDALEVAIDRVL